MNFVYPTNFAMEQIMPNLMARGMEGRIGLQICPPENVNAGTVRWEQEDDYYGLQALRGLDGAPTHVQHVGSKIYNYEPGVFGEFSDITETELTLRAGSSPSGTAIDVSDLVVKRDSLLIGREYDRMESSVWSILVSGILQIKLDGPNGTQVAYSDTYTTQTFTATIAWSNHSSSTPLADLQAMQQLSVGYSVDFGPDSTLYLNRVQLNHMLNNTNASDLGGRRTAMGATLNSLADLNRYFVEQGLPAVAAYDQGYRGRIATTGATSFVKYIPNGKGVLVGKRPGGVPIMKYKLTRNASNNFNPGSYRYVVDRANGINGEKRTPANIEVHRGHSGGPALLYPSAVVQLSC